MQPNDPMVSIEWLADNIENPDILVVDATWSMPGDTDPLPGTFIGGGRFDIDEIANTSSGFAHR